MADLISRAAAIDHMKAMADCAKCDHYNYVRCRACSWDDAMNIVDELPAVDAVPVVRCRDCKHRDPEDKKCDCGAMTVQGLYFPRPDNWFCAAGERRDGE